MFDRLSILNRKTEVCFDLPSFLDRFLEKALCFIQLLPQLVRRYEFGVELTRDLVPPPQSYGLRRRLRGTRPSGSADRCNLLAQAPPKANEFVQRAGARWRTYRSPIRPLASSPNLAALLGSDGKLARRLFFGPG